MKRIYIAGPMTGIPDLNKPAFHAEAARLRALGYEVENPAEVELHADATWTDYMRADIPLLCTCDAIVLLDNWADSMGAALEFRIARDLGMYLRVVGELVDACATESINHPTPPALG